ncbi:MAG TPA: MBL fold metallo-hydrolase [Spirochaetia bacterium]|nr:MBL fold metallo-hydrolase [Spirochaetia bacterium]
MQITFWGVRGSIPTPLTPQRLQNKIASVIQRVEPKDLVSPESREAFLADLPPSLLGTVGGNTTCIELRLADDTMVIFDAGSGIRELGAELKKRNDHVRHYHIFFSHFHWDHIQGLPFFSPVLFDSRCEITFYSPVAGFESILRDQMRHPYFPITMDDVTAKISFQHLDTRELSIGRARIAYRKMKHPGESFSYRVSEDGHTMIFSTDTELSPADFIKDRDNSAFFSNVDCIILDTQYTLGEAIEKYDWGHSSYSLAVDFAIDWGIKKLVLFHHEPLYDDKKMFNIQKSARWYAGHLEHKDVEILLAQEGLVINI